MSSNKDKCCEDCAFLGIGGKDCPCHSQTSTEGECGRSIHRFASDGFCQCGAAEKRGGSIYYSRDVSLDFAEKPLLSTDRESWEERFVEEGAALEHERWAKWQAYLHSKCVEHENGKGEWVCFPSERMRHWNRQIETPYTDLSEKEKESDRAEVRQYLPLIKALLKERDQELLRVIDSRMNSVLARYSEDRPIPPAVMRKEWEELKRTITNDI